MSIYDDGEVLPGLNDSWSFLGANAMEWCVGLAVFLMIGSCARTPASAMPMMMMGWFGTTFTLAGTRRTFPDEERGTRNAVMTFCGFPPPGIPTPSSMQPVWSACPVKELGETTRFRQLGLDQLFPSNQRELSDPSI